MLIRAWTSPRPQWRRAASSRASAVRSAGAPNRASASQIIPLRYSDPAAVARSPLRPSLFALAFLLLLLVASAIFMSQELADETPWAMEVCERAKNFCEHPEWSAMPAVLMAVVFLAVKGERAAAMRRTAAERIRTPPLLRPTSRVSLLYACPTRRQLQYQPHLASRWLAGSLNRWVI